MRPVFVLALALASLVSSAFAEDAARAKFKGPVHTCVIKQYPGLQEFMQGLRYDYDKDKLQVLAYSQAPHFVFYGASGEHIATEHVAKTASVQEVRLLLDQYGIRPEADYFDDDDDDDDDDEEGDRESVLATAAVGSDGSATLQS